MTNTTPPASAKAPTIGGRGILLSLLTEALSGPRSMTFSRVVYVMPFLAVLIDGHDALGGAFEERPDARLARSELRPQLLLLRNISGGRLNLGRLARLVGQDLINAQVPTDLSGTEV